MAGKYLVATLAVILTTSSLLLVESVNGQSAPKLSAPEFTVQYVDHSYDIPPVYGIDPFTGLNEVQQEGKHVSNRTVEFRIKNQPFTAYKDKDGNEVSLYYAILGKGHFADGWSKIMFPPNGYFASTETKASSDEYTVISYAYEESSWGITSGQVDFKVQALAGYSYVVWNHEHIQPLYEGTFFKGYGESDLSDVQTVSIPGPLGGLSFIGVGFSVVFTIVAIVTVIVVILVMRKEKRISRNR